MMLGFNIRGAAKMKAKLRTLPSDTQGGPLIEFALLAPIFILALIGVLQLAVYLQNYNAVRSVTSDGARYVMVEYQKNNTVTDEQIRSVVLGLAVNAPYLLDTDRLSIDIDRSGTSRISGATEIDIDVSYTPPDYLPQAGIQAFTVSYSRPVFVVN